MTALEQEVYEKIVANMDVDTSELQGFDENCPLFGEGTPERPSMNLDSIDSLELTILIEKEWGLGEIAREDMVKMLTVKAIADYIEAQRKVEGK